MEGSREEVVTDSVPSPPRPIQNDQNQNNVMSEDDIRPKSPAEPSAHPYQGEESQKTDSDASPSKPPKSRRGKPSNNSVKFVGCHNVVFGNVTNNNIFGKNNSPFIEKQEGKWENDVSTLSETNRKLLRDLEASKKEVNDEDFILVSACLTLEGIKILARKVLSVKKQTFSQLLHRYEAEHSELCFQILQHWKDLCKKRHGNTAMLNVLSLHLVRIWNMGGDEALRSLHKHHYPDSTAA